MATFVNLGLAREVNETLKQVQSQHSITQQQVLDLAKQERGKWQGNMNDLDVIACMVLATAWSGQNPQSKKTQFDVTKQTVAVICIKGKLYLACDGLTWQDFTLPQLVQKHVDKGMAGPNAALHTPNWTEKQRESYVTSFDKQQAKRVEDPSFEIEDPDTGLLKFRTQQAIQHSLRIQGERRPVEFIDSNDDTRHSEMRLLEFMADYGRPDDNLLGVSKPCCEQCKEQLEKYHIVFSCWHNFAVGNWGPPKKGPA